MTFPIILDSTSSDLPTTPVREAMVKELQIDLAPDLSAAAAARVAVKDALGWWNQQELKQTTIILVSELVANAIRHAQPPYTLSLGLTRDHLLAAVADGSPQLPVMREPSPTEGGGWGLQLVNQLSDRWGCEREALGKSVWVVLERW